MTLNLYQLFYFISSYDPLLSLGSLPFLLCLVFTHELPPSFSTVSYLLPILTELTHSLSQHVQKQTLYIAPSPKSFHSGTTQPS